MTENGLVTIKNVLPLFSEMELISELLCPKHLILFVKSESEILKQELCAIHILDKNLPSGQDTQKILPHLSREVSLNLKTS